MYETSPKVCSVIIIITDFKVLYSMLGSPYAVMFCHREDIAAIVTARSHQQYGILNLVTFLPSGRLNC